MITDCQNLVKNTTFSVRGTNPVKSTFPPQGIRFLNPCVDWLCANDSKDTNLVFAGQFRKASSRPRFLLSSTEVPIQMFSVHHSFLASANLSGRFVKIWKICPAAIISGAFMTAKHSESHSSSISSWNMSDIEFTKHICGFFHSYGFFSLSGKKRRLCFAFAFVHGLNS